MSRCRDQPSGAAAPAGGARVAVRLAALRMGGLRAAVRVAVVCAALLSAGAATFAYEGAPGAAPTVTVRGRASIRVVGVYSRPEGTTVVGELQDRDLGTGIGGRTIELQVNDGRGTRTLRATTDASGRFTATLPPGGTSFRVSARFDGDLTYAGEAQEPQSLDVSKQTLEITLATDAELDAAHAFHTLRITTLAEGKPVPVIVSLRTDRGRDLGQVHTGARGEATARLETASLGEPGPFGIQAYFAGDDRHNPASRRLEAVLVTSVDLTLRAAARTVEADESIRLEGEARDRGGAISGAIINLEVMGRTTATAVTDAEGRYSFKVAAAEYPPGRLDLVARHAPVVIWRRAAASPPVEIEIRVPRPIPLRFYLAPALATLAVILVLLGIRFLPALRRALQARAEEAPPPAGEEPEPLRSGLRPSRSSAGFRTLIRQAFDLWGVVWDPTDKRPLAGATITIAGLDGGTTCASDRDGRFNVPRLPGGVHQVTVSLAGYVHETFPIQIPHRGHLHDVRVELVQVRVRLLEIYREAAVPLLPDRELWARWTPRELVRHIGARAGRRQRDLEDLTLLLEGAYWSGRPPAEELLEQARGLAAATPR